MSSIQSIKPEKDEACEMGYTIGTFLGENIYLLIALIIGLIAVIFMWKYIKNTPDAGTPPER